LYTFLKRDMQMSNRFLLHPRIWVLFISIVLLSVLSLLCNFVCETLNVTCN